MSKPSLAIGGMKAKLRTITLRAEIEGTISSCIVDLLRFVQDPVERVRILEGMRHLHEEMVSASAARQAAALAQKPSDASPASKID